MEFRGQIFDTFAEWSAAESLAHKECLEISRYTSKKYSSSPIITNDDKFVLVELYGFEEVLGKTGLSFQVLNTSIIKQPEL